MQDETARTVWISWGVALLTVVAAWVLGGPVWPWVFGAIGAACVLRGHFPQWFTWLTRKVLIVGTWGAAITGAVIGTAWLFFRYFHGSWSDRLGGGLIGAIISIVFVWLAFFDLKRIRIKRGGTNAALEMPKGFLDCKLDAEAAMHALPAIITKLGAVMAEVGRSIEGSTGQFQRATSTAQQLRVTASASSNLDRFSARTERIQKKYVAVSESLSSGLKG